MQIQKYSVNQQSVSVLLAWVQSGEIAIPEIQRPFVWDASKVRDLMDSLYQGFPKGIVFEKRQDSETQSVKCLFRAIRSINLVIKTL